MKCKHLWNIEFEGIPDETFWVLTRSHDVAEAKAKADRIRPCGYAAGELKIRRVEWNGTIDKF